MMDSHCSIHGSVMYVAGVKHEIEWCDCLLRKNARKIGLVFHAVRTC